MPFRKGQKRGLTGPDYLLAIADEAAESGQPFAGEFRSMLMSCFSGQELFLIEMEASRPLKEHEASPVSIILGALAMASDRGDKESAQEILTVGLSILAKWPTWLAVTADGHPELDLKAGE